MGYAGQLGLILEWSKARDMAVAAGRCTHLIYLHVLFVIFCEAGSVDHLLHDRGQDPPVVVQNGSNQSVVLDCGYRLGRGDQLFHVKWFHIKTDYTQVYQWIQGMEPQALGPLRNVVNLTYRASDDENERYRAIEIIRPTVGLSGTYVCRANSKLDNQEFKRRLIVYAPPREMVLFYTKSEAKRVVNVTCQVDGAYPEPQLALYRGANTKTMVPIEGLQKYVSWRDGLYMVTAYWLTRDEFLHDQTVFVCVLVIPETSYRQQKQIVYYPGNEQLGPSEYATVGRGGAGGVVGAPRLETLYCLLLALAALTGGGVTLPTR